MISRTWGRAVERKVMFFYHQRGATYKVSRTNTDYLYICLLRLVLPYDHLKAAQFFHSLSDHGSCYRAFGTGLLKGQDTTDLKGRWGGYRGHVLKWNIQVYR